MKAIGFGPTDPEKGCVIFLAGRGGRSNDLLTAYLTAHMPDTRFIGIDPPSEWYPPPNGPDDQAFALEGIRTMRKLLSAQITYLLSPNIHRNKTALVGFSAGAVMAIQVAMRSKNPFAAVVAHAGAILEPRKVPICRCPDTKFLLIHDRKDECFQWKERYLPMKKALKKRGYLVQAMEKSTSHWNHHAIIRDDVLFAGEWLRRIFGYPGKHGEV